MTPDLDKFQSILQWAGGVVVVIGGSVAAIVKIMRGSGETDRERDERERGERSKRYQVEREAEMLRFEQKFEIFGKALREAVFVRLDEIDESMKAEVRPMQQRLTAVERDVAVITDRMIRPK